MFLRDRRPLSTLFCALIMLVVTGFASEREALMVAVSVDGLSEREKVRVPINLRGGVVGGTSGVIPSHPAGKPSSYSWHLRASERRQGRVILRLLIAVRYDDGSEKSLLMNGSRCLASG